MVAIHYWVPPVVDTPISPQASARHWRHIPPFFVQFFGPDAALGEDGVLAHSARSTVAIEDMDLSNKYNIYYNRLIIGSHSFRDDTTMTTTTNNNNSNNDNNDNNDETNNSNKT